MFLYLGPTCSDEALRDFDVKPTFDDDKSFKDTDALDWYRLASNFLEEAQQEDMVEKGKDLRAPKCASFDFCCALDNMNRVQHGEGLKLFEDERFIGHGLRAAQWPGPTEPGSKPWYGLCQDECNAVLSPVNFLIFEVGLRMTSLGDPSHAYQRNLWTSARQTGAWKILEAELAVD